MRGITKDKFIVSFLVLATALFVPVLSIAKGKKVYHVTEYGAVDSRTEYSTGAIQKAINEASAAGGGRVFVPAGTYLISPVELKSNVELYLDMGATLLGTADHTKYNNAPDRNYNVAGERGLVWSLHAKNISIKGKGTIDGQGEAVANHAGKLIAEGLLKDRFADQVKKRWESAGNFRAEWPRPQEANRPLLIGLYDSEDVVVDGIRIENGASWTTTFWRCNRLTVSNVTVNTVNFWNNDGIDLIDCSNAVVRGCNVNSADDGICLKSHNRENLCDNITIEECTVRSSASAIKFGTASEGGFRNVTIRNITVKDTYRSAIALEAVDGGSIDNVRIKGVRATNTWNAIFVIAGTRKTTNGVSTVSNVTIEDVFCQIPAMQPDLDYPFAVNRKLGHNLCPSLITGSPSANIRNITVRNLKVSFPGGGTKGKASRGVGELAVAMDKKYGNYPEYDMFGEMPAWGLVCRNIEGLRLENVEFVLENEDYRYPVVIDKVQGVTIRKMKIANDPKTPVVVNNSDVLSIKGIASPANTTGRMVEEFGKI